MSEFITMFAVIVTAIGFAIRFQNSQAKNNVMRARSMYDAMVNNAKHEYIVAYRMGMGHNRAKSSTKAALFHTYGLTGTEQKIVLEDACKRARIHIESCESLANMPTR